MFLLKTVYLGTPIFKLRMATRHQPMGHNSRSFGDLLAYLGEISNTKREVWSKAITPLENNALTL